MPDCNKSRALYSTCVTGLSFACFALAAAATALPLWGYFINPLGMGVTDRGHFGPWQICKESYYGKTKCGETVSRFQPITAVKISGYFAVMGVILLAAFCISNVLHLAIVVSREKVLLSYSATIIAKFILSLLSSLALIIAVGLFSLQADDRANSYQVNKGESYYMQIGLIMMIFVLVVCALYDVVQLRKANTDPTAIRDPAGVEAVTFNNPGYRDRHIAPIKQEIAMTDSSGKPYSSIISGKNGSTISTLTNLSCSDGSTVVPNSALPRSPLRSSLKKPRPAADSGLGIQNPGFSRSSPILNRNGGSVKKVRIQTQSTAV